MFNLSFSTNEAVSLEKRVELADIPCPSKTDWCKMDSRYEIQRCAEWIVSNKFQKVCLQFPDYMLPDSFEVSLRLQKLVNKTVYILSDSAYESCCIDFIAAAHINADAIIHFGLDCFSASSRNIPYLKIYEKLQLDLEKLKITIEEFGNDNINILVDTTYFHLLSNIQQVFKKCPKVRICKIDDVNNDFEASYVVFIGNVKKLRNITFAINAKQFFLYDGKLYKSLVETQLLKKRNFLIEKIKDSKTIGIIIGTLSVKNYSQIIERMQKLIELCYKKYYIINVGKPTVAKLANFPELDIYVAITCSMNEIFESRDFYVPVVTPYDIEVALNSNYNRDINFSYDYNSFLKESNNMFGHSSERTDVSLLSNNIRSFRKNKEPDGNHQISLKSDGTVTCNSDIGFSYLAARSWRGLEQKLGQDQPELAHDGRTGVAQRYQNENVS